MKTLLVIPCFDHNEYLYELIKTIRKYYKGEILCIDDGCKDTIVIDDKNIQTLIDHLNK